MKNPEERAVIFSMVIDSYNRKIDYIRISLTDRCNLRCKYCMPDGINKKLQHEDILSYEMLLKIIRSLTKLGIEKIKITGGEPFVRKQCHKFIAEVKKIDGVKEVSVTTNGLLLRDKIDFLLDVGIDGINISLDSLKKERYRALCGGDLDVVLDCLDYIIKKNYKNLKINTLIIKGFNEDEIEDIAKIAKNNPVNVRFIELMPIANAKKFSGVTRDYIQKRLKEQYGPIINVTTKLGNGPADYITFDNFKANIGFIDAIDHKFCEKCNRVRLTSTGKLKLCLQYDDSVDLSDYAKGEINETQFLEKVRRALLLKPKENKFKNLEDVVNENTSSMNEIGG